MDIVHRPIAPTLEHHLRAAMLLLLSSSMSRSLFRTSAVLLLCTFLAGALHAQVTQLTLDAYQALKAAGTLPPRFHVAYATNAPDARPTAPAWRGMGASADSCACWIPVDDTYALALQAADDGSSPLITLPFTFNLFGEALHDCYINNNGNVSFGDPLWTFSAATLPFQDYPMVAPFWGDVDTRADSSGVYGGRVLYKLTPTALYVTWDSVGYFAKKHDKRNSFQLVLTDGTDPVIGVGNNVGFCYGDMQWTTGEASCAPADTICTYNGTTVSCNNGGGLGYGFCGYGATVGVNGGDAVHFLQIATTDHPEADYDGPIGAPDGVDWLDGKHFVFNTADTLNQPPLPAGTTECDTLHVCWAAPVEVHQTFLAPETDQLVEVGYVVTPPLLVPVMVTVNGPGAAADIALSFIPEAGDTGVHVISFTATDNGVPAQVRVVQRILDIGCFNTAVDPGIDPATPLNSFAPVPMTDRGVLHTARMIGAQDRILLTDASGRLLRLWRGNGTHELSIDGVGLSAGIYQLRIQRHDATEEVVRLVVE